MIDTAFQNTIHQLTGTQQWSGASRNERALHPCPTLAVILDDTMFADYATLKYLARVHGIGVNS